MGNSEKTPKTDDKSPPLPVAPRPIYECRQCKVIVEQGKACPRCGRSLLLD